MDKIAAYGEALSQNDLWEVDYLLKTASAEEIYLTEQLTKVAAYGTAEDLLEIIALADELGIDKEAGIFARALSGLGKGMGAVGRRIGSKSLTMGGARLGRRGALSAKASYDAAANAFRSAPVRGGGGLAAMQRAQKARSVAQDAAQAALANRAAAQNMTGIRANLAEGLGALRQRASSGVSSVAQRARQAVGAGAQRAQQAASSGVASARRALAPQPTPGQMLSLAMRGG